MFQGKRRNAGLGCGYFLWVCLIACILLVLNSAVVWMVFQALLQTNPDLKENQILLQAVMVSVPVLLIFVEYAIYDLIVDLLVAHRD